MSNTNIVGVIIAGFSALYLLTLFLLRRCFPSAKPRPLVVAPACGAHSYQNPYDPPELVALIQQVLNHRAVHSYWPAGTDDDTKVMIMKRVLRSKREQGEEEKF